MREIEAPIAAPCIVIIGNTLFYNLYIYIYIYLKLTF